MRQGLPELPFGVLPPRPLACGEAKAAPGGSRNPRSDRTAGDRETRAITHQGTLRQRTLRSQSHPHPDAASPRTGNRYKLFRRRRGGPSPSRLPPASSIVARPPRPQGEHPALQDRADGHQQHPGEDIHDIVIPEIDRRNDQRHDDGPKEPEEGPERPPRIDKDQQDDRRVPAPEGILLAALPAI